MKDLYVNCHWLRGECNKKPYADVAQKLMLYQDSLVEVLRKYACLQGDAALVATPTQAPGRWHTPG